MAQLARKDTWSFMNSNIRKLIAYLVEVNDTYKSTNEIVEGTGIPKRSVQRYLETLLPCGRLLPDGNGSSVKYRLSSPQAHFDSSFLFVYKGSRLAGYLGWNRTTYRFAYNNKYLAYEHAQPVSPSLPLTEQVEEVKRLFAAFDQSLPEGHDRKLLETKYGTANEFDLLPMLPNPYGDIKFSRTELDDEEIGHDHEMDFQKIKWAILDANDFPNILEHALDIKDEALFPEKYDLATAARAVQPTGLSGFQHKLSIAINDDEGRIYQAEEGEASVVFLKPYSPAKADPASGYYFPHLAINEHLFMTFAKNELGFDVPMSGLVKREEDQEYHYMVKRYDRLGTSRFAHNEVATLMGLDSETKYNTTTEKMATRLKEYLLSPDERLMFLKYVFYSMLIVHEDMHTKNLSVMTEGNRVYMSPLYDIATTSKTIYQNSCGHESHLPINGKRENIRPRDFSKVVKIMEVPPEEFRREAAKILKAYSNRLGDYIQAVRDHFPKAQVHVLGKATYPGQRQKILRTVPLADLLEKQWRERIEELADHEWYHYLGVAPFQTATLDDFESMKDEKKIVKRLQLYREVSPELAWYAETRWTTARDYLVEHHPEVMAKAIATNRV